MSDSVNVMTIRAILKKADRLREQADMFEALGKVAMDEMTHVPMKKRASVSVAFRRVDGAVSSRFELVKGGDDG